MKSVQYICLASASVNAYAPASSPYDAPAQYNAPAPAPATSGYGAPPPDPVYGAPTDPTHEEQSVAQFDQFWGNAALCHAELKLDTCLMNSKTFHQFFDEQRIADCTVLFVQDLCGQISASPSKSSDNGHVSLTEENCPTAAFADAFLVLNRIISDLDEILGGSMTNYNPWTFATIEMAKSASRNNADCVTQSLLHFLEQCKTSKVINEVKQQCVVDVLDKSSCDISKPAHSWTLPALLSRYGLDAAKTAVSDLKKTHGSSEVIPALQDVMESLASMDSNAMHTVSTTYNNVKHESSITVCPKQFVPMNAMHYRGAEVGGIYQEMTGPLGLREELVFFHFPSNVDNINKHDEDSPLGDNVPLDPLTNYDTIYDTCMEYFEATKVTHTAKEIAAKAKATYVKPNHEGNQCYSISGYNVHFLESGRDEPLNYETLVKDGDYLRSDPVSNGDDGFQCFKASWHEARTCSSHLTKWQMKVACCKSYGTIVDANAQEGTTDGYQLLQDGQDTSQYEPTTPAAYPPAPQQYDPTYANYSPTTSYYHPTEPSVTLIDKKSLMFEHYVDSNSQYGSLASVSGPEDPASADNVIAAIDAAVAEQQALCDDIDPATLAAYTHGYGYDLQKLCEEIAKITAAILADKDAACECTEIRFCKDGTQATSTLEGAPDACRCEYTCTDGTAADLCDAGEGALGIEDCPLCDCATTPQYCRKDSSKAFLGEITVSGSNPPTCVCEYTCGDDGTEEVCPIDEISLKVDECECSCLSEARVCMIERNGQTNLYPDAVVSSSSGDSTACECEVTCVQQSAVLCKAGTGILRNGARIPCEVESEGTEATTNAVSSHYPYHHSTTEYVIKESYYMEDYASKTACDALSIDLDFTKIIPLVNTECFPQSCILAQLATCMEIPEKDHGYGYDYVTGGHTEHTPYGGYPQTLMEASTSTVSTFTPLVMASVGVVSGMAVLLVAQYVAKARQSSSLLG